MIDLKEQQIAEENEIAMLFNLEAGKTIRILKRWVKVTHLTRNYEEKLVTVHGVLFDSDHLQKVNISFTGLKTDKIIIKKNGKHQ